jgi:hypothetical protein
MRAGVLGVAAREVVFGGDSLVLTLIAEVGYSGKAIIDGLGIKSNPSEVAVVAIISPITHVRRRMTYLSSPSAQDHLIPTPQSQFHSSYPPQLAPEVSLSL